MGLATKTKAYFFFLTSPTATPINPLNLHALPILGRLRKKEKKKSLADTQSNHAKTNLHLVRSLKNVSSIYEIQAGASKLKFNFDHADQKFILTFRLPLIAKF